MLEAKNLSKVYQVRIRNKPFFKGKTHAVEAVKELSLRIEKGTIVGLLGVNGAGKTTTIKMLTTMISPTSGEIQIDEIDAVKDPDKAKKRINIITGGERNIYWRLTAKENLEYFGSLYGLAGRELQDRIDAVLDVVKLKEHKDLVVEKYSKGMKQRLQIARGLLNDPDYLFLDEPTLGLDVFIAKEIKRYIKKICKESHKGVLLTTHYMAEAEELCDYVYIIDKGKIIASGAPDELKRNYLAVDAVRIEFDGMDDDFVSGLKAELGDLDYEICREEGKNSIQFLYDPIVVKRIFECALDSDVGILSCQHIDDSLESLIITLVENNMNGKLDCCFNR